MAGRYRLDRRLGRGGGAEVWEGFDTILARPVALTLPVEPATLATSAAGRDGFAGRARSAARISHPGLVATYDAGEDAGQPFAVTELVRGWTLETLARRGPFRPGRSAAVGAQVAAALDHVHRCGMVHGHLSAATIVLDGDGRAKVADLGGIGSARGAAAASGAGFAVDIVALGTVLISLAEGQVGGAALETIARRAAAGGFESADGFGLALAALGEDVDDAIPFVERDPTPPIGIRPVSRALPRNRSGEIVAVSLAVLVAATAAFVLGGRPSSGSGDGGGGSPSGTAAQPVVIASATAFDPGGDRKEGQPEMAIDGRADTSWQTETYRGPHFGGLAKQGVGLILRLGAADKLGRLQIASPSKGWSAQVFVTAAPAASLAGWGTPVASVGPVEGGTSIDLGGKGGGAVLLWLTDLGPTFRVQIDEVTLARA